MILIAYIARSSYVRTAFWHCRGAPRMFQHESDCMQAYIKFPLFHPHRYSHKKTFVDALIHYWIMCKDEGIIFLLPRYHFACRILRPLYCHSVYSTLMACPFNDGYRFQLLDICLSFTRTARRWGLNHSLLPSLINWRLSVSGDMKKSFPVLRIWLLICTLKYSFVDNLSIRKLNIS